MKTKLLGSLAVTLAILFCACGGKSKSDSADSAKKMQATHLAHADTTPCPPIHPIPSCGNCTTLNGVDYRQATKMMNDYHCDHPGDSDPKSASVWFTRGQVDTMRRVLLEQKGAIDGVRFYLGEKSKNGTKLEIKILLITTKEKNPKPLPADDNSIHEDYACQSSLLTAPLGKDFDHQATDVLSRGGYLYSDSQPIMGAVCTDPLDLHHRMLGHDAYDWVQKRHDQPDTHVPSRRDNSAYNTESEWFDICFVSSLFTAIANTHNKLTGLRLYLGKGLETNDGVHDVVILVPTRRNDTTAKEDDYYDCLALLPSSLCGAAASEFFKRKPTKEELKTWFMNRYFRRTKNYMDGGYDNGEICPTHCP